MTYYAVRYIGGEYIGIPNDPQNQIFLTRFAAESFRNFIPDSRNIDRRTEYYDPVNDSYILSDHTWAIQEIENDLHLLKYLDYWNGLDRPTWPLRNYPEHMVHYLPDDDLVHFWDGRRLESIKAGRYINRYYKDRYTKPQVEFYARWFIDRKRPPSEITATVKFATTPDEIRKAYQDGPDSCMLNSSSVGVYGAGDLAVAYLESTDGFSQARVLCRPSTKVFGRSYGRFDDNDDNFANQLEHLLREQGYVSLTENPTGFEGAKLLREEVFVDERGSERTDGGSIWFKMPYLDWNMGLNTKDWTLTRYNHESDDFRYLVDADNTNGVVYLSSDPCLVCGKPSLTLRDHTRPPHNDFPDHDRPHLCPEHRSGDFFTDARNNGRYLGVPTYISPTGEKYSTVSVKANLWQSLTGTWYWKPDVYPLRLDTGERFAEHEAEELGIHKNRHVGWTRRSKKELNDEFFHEEVKAQSDLAYWEARLAGIPFHDLIWKVTRSPSPEYVEIQAASRF